MTKIRIDSRYGKPHTYRSILTWMKAHKRASYAYQLEMLKRFAKHDIFQPFEKDIINERINNIVTNHSDCLYAI